LVRKVDLLPLGWRLESIDDGVAVYRFDGETHSRGVRKRLTLVIKVVRCLDSFDVYFPDGCFGEFKRKEFNYVTKKSESEVKHFISKLMDKFTRRFYGFARKRTPIYNIILP